MINLKKKQKLEEELFEELMGERNNSKYIDKEILRERADQFILRNNYGEIEYGNYKKLIDKVHAKIIKIHIK